VILNNRFSKMTNAISISTKKMESFLLHDIFETIIGSLRGREYGRPTAMRRGDGGGDRNCVWIFKTCCAGFRLILRTMQGEGAFTKEKVMLTGYPEPERT